MSKKKTKKKGKLAAPVVAGLLLLGAIGGAGDDASTNVNSTAPDNEPPAIVETVPSEKETSSTGAENKTETSEPVKQEQSLPPVESNPPQQVTEPSPQPPVQAVDPEQAFRDKLAQYNFVGSSESDKYHEPKCRWTSTINDSNLVHFDTEEEARNAGYQPCGTCEP